MCSLTSSQAQGLVQFPSLVPGVKSGSGSVSLSQVSGLVRGSMFFSWPFFILHPKVLTDEIGWVPSSVKSGINDLAGIKKNQIE